MWGGGQGPSPYAPPNVQIFPLTTGRGTDLLFVPRKEFQDIGFNFGIPPLPVA